MAGILSIDETRKILKFADLPGSPNRDLQFSLASKAERLATIHDSTKSRDVKTAAAIEIQRIWRGYSLRCKMFSIMHPSASVMSTVAESQLLTRESRLSEVLYPQPAAPHPTPRTVEVTIKEVKSPKKMGLVQRRYKEYCDRTVAEEGQGVQLMPFLDFCAAIIQRWWRLLRAFQGDDFLTAPPPTTVGDSKLPTPSLAKDSAGSDLATSEITDVADTLESRDDSGINSDRQNAAKVIQKSWRRHIDVQVFRYYRDLINFKTKGDPSLMLRCINPREAQLLDAASGVHIKFRLAGEKFPPNIYYKIFTHRNVADICSFAPRDYTAFANKKAPPKLVPNRGYSIAQEDPSQWYERWENNGWRLVSDRLIKKLDQDPVVYESAQKKYNFNHSKVVRRVDLEKKRKRRKIEWMKKMYKEGMLKGKSVKDQDTENLIRTVAEGMVCATDKKGDDAVEDWEVDELLEWTDGLNFDQYQTEWKEFATSAGSEYLTEQSRFLPNDPFSLTLQGAS